MSSPLAQTVTYELRRSEPVSIPVGRVPRVTCLLALAHEIDGMVRSGEIRDWAEASHLVGVTQARMTQTPEGDDPTTERALNSPWSCQENVV